MDMGKAPPTIRIKPMVRYNKSMVRGKPHLVEVDLRLADSTPAWLYPDDEVALTVALSGIAVFHIESVDDNRIVLHRDGSSNGHCRFVVTPNGPRKLDRYSLALSVFTQGGVLAWTSLLSIRISSATWSWRGCRG